MPLTLEERVTSLEGTIRQAKGWLAGVALGLTAVTGITFFTALTKARAMAEEIAGKEAERVVLEKLPANVLATVEANSKAVQVAMESAKADQGKVREIADSVTKSSQGIAARQVLVGGGLHGIEPKGGDWTTSTQYPGHWEFNQQVKFDPPFPPNSRVDVMVALNHLYLRQSTAFNVEVFVRRDTITPAGFTATFMTSTPDPVYRFHAQWLAVGQVPP